MEPGLRVAIKLAENHPFPDLDYKHAAVLAKGRRIVATGFNSKKTHPHAPFRHGLQTIHAEISVLLPFDILRRRPGTSNDIASCTLFVARIGDGGPALSRPCKYCYQVLKTIGIERIVYTTDNEPYFKEEYL